ncbi:superoxide dismutase family protein [Rhodobacteraceae bacterium]|nr:superoxide dismutase family protein [Paracoccaceae bacterium]
MAFTNRFLVATTCAALATPLWADGHIKEFAAANVSGPEQGITGQVHLDVTASGVVLVRIDLSGLPEGTLGMHLHETGDCSAADFKSAGGHIAGEREHGIETAGGPHPGDLPNMTVQANGILKAEVFLSFLDPEAMIADGDGAAFIVHDGPDDYTSQPAGDAGSRIACGVFEKAG